MTARLIELWSHVNRACASPWTALLALVTMTVWFAISIYSNGGSVLLCDGHGHFGGCAWDPGGNYGNDLQNEVQLVLLFVACSLGARHVKHATQVHKKLEELHRAVDDLAKTDE